MQARALVHKETVADIPGIRSVIQAAFGRADEADLVDALRRADGLSLSLVAQVGGLIIGHLAFSPVTIGSNQANGGAGTVRGGDGQGGGIFNTIRSTVALLGSPVTNNRANGGTGLTPGRGIGGGINVSGGTVCADALTAISANDASTSDDDVFGSLASCD